ncbi:MAG: SRPBCC family protein [Anaerolineae bacterium]|nr:SRPBCC family protein [Anaerolineae bacterium]
MGRAEANMIVDAPIDAVWNCLNDIDNTPKWVVGLEAAEIKSVRGEYGIGTIYVDHNRLGPIPQTTPWTITVFEPMATQVHESASAVLPSKMILKLRREAQRTHVQMIVKYRFLPRLGVISRMLERLLMNTLLKQVLKQNLASLDAYL